MHKNELKDPLCPFTHTLKDEFIIFSGRRCYWSDQEGRGLVDGPHRRQGRRVPLQLCSTCWWTSKLPFAISTCDTGGDLISHASKYGNIWIPKLFKDQIWNGLDFGGSRYSYSSYGPGHSKTGPFNFQMFLPKFQMGFHKIATIFQISNGQALGLQVPVKIWTNANQFLFDGSKSGSVQISDPNCIALSTCQVALSLRINFFLYVHSKLWCLVCCLFQQ